MDAVELDRVIVAALLVDAADGLTSVADQLVGLYDSWVRAGVAPDAVEWLGGLLGQLGWWSGRLEGAADPALVAQFPRMS